MNLTVFSLAQKLVCLEDIEGGKFDVVSSCLCIGGKATEEVAV